MEFSEYQRRAMTTAVYQQHNGMDWLYPMLGLSGEVGELASKFAKAIRGDHTRFDLVANAVKKETGDVLWMLAALAYEFGFNLDEIAQENLDKLAKRQANGTLKGDGDDR